MKLFQSIFARAGVLDHLDRLCGAAASFEARRATLIAEGINGVHLLEPVVDGSPDAFLTCFSDEKLQRAWAAERGMPASASGDDILVAQVEEAGSEVFYTMSPHLFGPDFLKRLPGSVRLRICWHSPPSPVGDLSGYDLLVNNFPRNLELYGETGVRTAFFTPSFTHVMAEYCDNVDRPIDVVFVGGFTRKHLDRSATLDAVARLSDRHNIRFFLQPDRLVRLAETPLGLVPPLSRFARSRAIRNVSGPGLFGRDLYRTMAQAKITLNGAIDAAAGDRGNIRCFEAMGCGTLLLSDPGRYPEGMEDGKTMCLHRSPDDAADQVRRLLADEERRRSIAASGLALMKEHYSKRRQWERFQALCA